MKKLIPFLALSAALLPPCYADDAALLEKSGTLLFADDFERKDGSLEKDALGKGWTSNSPWRADDQKQAFIEEGALHVVTVEDAGHAAVLFQSLSPAFRDGAIRLKLRAEAGESFAIEFNDPECKSVHSGHIAGIRMDDKSITLFDSKTGGMDLELREKRKANPKDKELKKLLASKSKRFPFTSTSDHWHDLLVVTVGDLMRVSVDGKVIGEFQSEGFAHATKQKINWTSLNSPDFDEIEIWSLDSK
ncbi:MAG: hypothetical protein P1U86_05565 [Verrucomicrobiales bacterium]|nr:hypothetical protein [Verrucomicrobiales bacterium]